MVKSTISNKLKNVPVQKSVVTKSGQGCIFFPTKDDQAQAQSILQDDFKVSSSTNKVKFLLPKLKVFKIDETYKKEDKEVLKADILKKNPYIGAFNLDQYVFEVIIIDEKQNYCILKVSPEIREAIKKRGSIFINMESHMVKDQVHVIQCFCCQEHGHKKGENECKLKTLVKTSVYIVVVTMNLGTVNLKKIPPIGIAQTVPTAITLITKPTQKDTQQLVLIAHL